jgi:clan AA aspartic protease
MGKIFADITIQNSDDSALVRRGYIQPSEIRSLPLSILVDTGAYNLAINQRIFNQLGLTKLGEQTFILADGSEQIYDIVGPVDIKFENRETTTRAVLLPGNAEPLIGQIPLEDMDVILLPKEERMIVNPESPYLARKDLK